MDIVPDRELAVLRPMRTLSLVAFPARTLALALSLYTSDGTSLDTGRTCPGWIRTRTDVLESLPEVEY